MALSPKYTVDNNLNAYFNSVQYKKNWLLKMSSIFKDSYTKQRQL